MLMVVRFEEAEGFITNNLLPILNRTNKESSESYVGDVRFHIQKKKSFL
jgi:hypothetical protein